MAEYEDEFSWEPIEFATEDGYILTSFIIKSIEGEMTNPPVLVHHGNGQDAATWIKSLTPENPQFDEVTVLEPVKAEDKKPEVEPEAEAEAATEGDATTTENAEGTEATENENDGGTEATTTTTEGETETANGEETTEGTATGEEESGETEEKVEEKEEEKVEEP